MSKGLSAEDLVDLIEVKKAKRKQRAYDSLRASCMAAISDMADTASYTTEVDLKEMDLLALTQVTEELRELNYKFRFIEVQNTSGNAISYKLLISVEHAR